VIAGPDGDDHLVFHAWNGSFTERELHVLPIRWGDDGPDVVIE
jgi:hypothetical protein